MITPSVSHSREQETPEAKARWFKSLSIEERMDYLCFLTDLVFQNIRVDVQTFTPGLVFEQAWEQRETVNYHGQTFYIVSVQDLIASKKAAGRAKDIEDVRMLQVDQNE